MRYPTWCLLGGLLLWGCGTPKTDVPAPAPSAGGGSMQVMTPSTHPGGHAIGGERGGVMGPSPQTITLDMSVQSVADGMMSDFGQRQEAGTNSPAMDAHVGGPNPDAGVVHSDASRGGNMPQGGRPATMDGLDATVLTDGQIGVIVDAVTMVEDPDMLGGPPDAQRPRIDGNIPPETPCPGPSINGPCLFGYYSPVSEPTSTP